MIYQIPKPLKHFLRISDRLLIIQHNILKRTDNKNLSGSFMRACFLFWIYVAAVRGKFYAFCTACKDCDIQFLFQFLNRVGKTGLRNKKFWCGFVYGTAAGNFKYVVKLWKCHIRYLSFSRWLRIFSIIKPRIWV